MALKDLKWSLQAAVRVVCWYAIWFTLAFVCGVPAYLLSDVLPPQLILLWAVALLPCTAFVTHALMVRPMVINTPIRDGAKSVTLLTKKGGRRNG
jgi:hypothetical protein